MLDGPSHRRRALLGALSLLLLVALSPLSAKAEGAPGHYSLRLSPELALALLEPGPAQAGLEPARSPARDVGPLAADELAVSGRTRWLSGSAMLAVSTVSLMGWAAFAGPPSEYVLDEDYVCQDGSWIPLSGMGVAALIGIPLVVAGAMKEKRGSEQGGSPSVVGRRTRVRRVVAAVLGAMLLNIAGYAAAVPDFMCNT